MSNIWNEILKSVKVDLEDLLEELNFEVRETELQRCPKWGDRCKYSKFGFRKIFAIWTSPETRNAKLSVCWDVANRFNSILSSDEGETFYQLILQKKLEFIEYLGKPGIPCKDLAIRLFNKNGDSVAFWERKNELKNL